MTATSIPSRRARPQPLLRALVATVPVGLAALLGGLATAPNIPTWYVHLAKPWFTPPNFVFGPAWTVLYAMMAYAIWRILGRAAMTHGRGAAIATFFVQLALNMAWSFAFFGAHSPLLGLVVIVPLWLSIAATMAQFWNIDRVAGLLFVPYLAWVSFASALNYSIWTMNG
jgi:benzodiazapine receptor